MVFFTLVGDLELTVLRNGLKLPSKPTSSERYQYYVMRRVIPSSWASMCDPERIEDIANIPAPRSAAEPDAR